MQSINAGAPIMYVFRKKLVKLLQQEGGYDAVPSVLSCSFIIADILGDLRRTTL